MKKRSVIILVSLLVASTICILLSTQFGVKSESEIIVSKPIYEVSPVLTKLKNWPEWFAGADQYQFRLINSSPAGINVQARRGAVQSVYSVVVYPDSIPSRTRIHWTSVSSGFDWIRQKLDSIADNPRVRLAGIKKYFDNPVNFYGFDIRLGKVEDSLVLTKEETVKTTGLDSVLRQLYKELAACARQENLRVNTDSCRMATFYDRKKDSIRVAAGIPITTRVSPPRAGIRLLEMPAKGKMLIGKYQGPYKGLPSLYSAMRKFIFDKKLVVFGAPYEKFLSKGSSARDSLDMTIELHFPVL